LIRRKANEETYAELGRKRLAGIETDTPIKSPPKQQSETTPEIEQPEEAAVEPATVPKVIIAPEIKAKPLPVIEQVAELSRAGFSPSLIAARLGVSISEVELAIAITGRTNAN
jgi:hypothetical protein